MAVVLKDTYKGYVITSDDRRYEILLDGVVQTSRPKSIEACVKWINDKLKEKFIRTKVLLREDYQKCDFKAVSATSVVDGDYAWVVHEDGRRERQSIHRLFVDNESNRTLTAKAVELQKQAKKLLDEKDVLIDSLERFDVGAMIVKKQSDGV